MTAHIVKFPTRLSETEEAELRARAVALATEYGVPPVRGDAGLIEAERRLNRLRLDTRALLREFPIAGRDVEVEAEIIEPTITEAVIALCRFIEETPPDTRAGAIVKLRHVENEGDSAETITQVLALLEQEARS
jgi:hypothetical protein